MTMLWLVKGNSCVEGAISDRRPDNEMYFSFTGFGAKRGERQLLTLSGLGTIFPRKYPALPTQEIGTARPCAGHPAYPRRVSSRPHPRGNNGGEFG
jgi:hypothetical protein